MSDDRPVEEIPDAIGSLRREFEDFKTSVLAQIPRSPTGTIEIALDNVAKAGTLIMQGQTLQRSEYPDLIRWVTERSLWTVWFGVGDGTTTFVLPDWRSRVPVGADATNVLGAKFGAASVALVAANLPLHSISGSIAGVGDHDHATTGAGGNHNNHFIDAGYEILTNGAPPGAVADHLAIDRPRQSSGSHGHPMNWDGGHTHGFSLTAGSASPTPVSQHQPSLGVNFLIWT